MVESAVSKKTRPVRADSVITAIIGGKYRSKVTPIRERYKEALAANNGDHSQAKRAVGELKKKLPAIMWSGMFSGRGDDKLAQYSGLVCADLDDLDNHAQNAVFERAKTDRHVFAAFRSPTGTGVKLVFRVNRDNRQHADSFITVKKHVLDAYGVPVDESCKNIERLCFISDDPDAILNREAEILPQLSTTTPVEPELVTVLPTKGVTLPPEQIRERKEIAGSILGAITWESDVAGFCKCPNRQSHTSETKADHTRVTIDGVPTVHCFHNSCRGAIEEINLRLRAEIRLAEKLTDLSGRLAELRFNIHSKPPVDDPRYFIGQIPICTVGNLTTISAGVKAGKSSVLAAMIAAAMTPNPGRSDCLGFDSRNPDGHAIIHLDTEQSRADHYALIERAMRRAGLAEPPLWLMSYCVTGFPPSDLRACLSVLLNEGVRTRGGIHSVLIDGVGDLVRDVNDPEECNSFVTELHALAIKFGCPIVGAIHFNPGTEKSRGHLGSQLERKAETNLRLDKTDGAMVLWSEKNRGAPIFKNSGPRFVWLDEAAMHVTSETLGNLRADARRLDLTRQAAAVFFNAGKPALRWNEMVSGLQVVVKTIGDSGARKRIEKMLDHNVITKNEFGQYRLSEAAPLPENVSNALAMAGTSATPRQDY
jgi:hypothetical protein